MTGNNINEADKLRELRADADLSLRRASEKTGISAMRISQIECGKGNPLTEEERDRLETAYRSEIPEQYIVRVPVRGYMCKAVGNWLRANKEVERIRNDSPSIKKLLDAGYMLKYEAFTYEATCRPQWMDYGEEEIKG